MFKCSPHGTQTAERMRLVATDKQSRGLYLPRLQTTGRSVPAPWLDGDRAPLPAFQLDSSWILSKRRDDDFASASGTCSSAIGLFHEMEFSWACSRARTKLGIAIAARSPMIATTIIISTNVNACFVFMFPLGVIKVTRSRTTPQQFQSQRGC